MLSSRPGASRRMVGRDDALAKLLACLRGVVREHRSVVVLVTGPAGIGKTRLVRELLDRVEDEATILAGQAQEFGPTRGFALVRDLVEQHLPDDGTLPEALERWYHPLAHVLAPSVRFDAHPDDGHAHGQDELSRAALAVIEHLLADGPGVAVFDDLHWADEESLDVLIRLARTGPPMLIVATFRPEDVVTSHPLTAAVSVLERQCEVTHLVLDGLDRADLHELITQIRGAPLNLETLDRLHRRTGGNPFFVEELLAGFGRDDADAVVDASLPWNTRAAVLRRLDRLGAQDRQVAVTAAVLGGRFELELLAEVADIEEQRAVEVVRRLIEAGVLAEGPEGRLGFRHALVRDVAGSELLRYEQRRLHARALEALRREVAAPPAALAHHAAAAGLASEAAEYARAAARLALQDGSPHSAAQLAGVALEADDEDLAAHELAARAAARVGTYDRAVRHARRWSQLAASSGATASRVAALATLAWVSWRAGDVQGCTAAIGEGTSLIGTLGDCPESAEFLGTQAFFLLVQRQPAEAVEVAARALVIADEQDAPGARALAAAARAGAILDSPQHQRQLLLDEAAMLLARAEEDAQDAGAVEILMLVLHNRLVPDQPDDPPISELRRRLEHARDVADRYGQQAFANKLDVVELHLEVTAGRMDAAKAVLRRTHHPHLLATEANWRAGLAAFVALERDDLDGALAALTEQEELSAEPYSAESAVETLTTRVAIAAHRGDADAAGAALGEVGGHLSQVCPCMAGAWWDIALDALAAGVAADTIREVRDRDAPAVVPRHRSAALELDGALLAVDGRDDRALEQLRGAVSALPNARRATRVADLHRRISEVLGRAGERGRAVEQLDAARERLRAWPGPRRDALERLERRLGSGERERHEVFTARELEVVRLLTLGYSNSDIADRLFITRKTASTHVSNILAKTGFDSRTKVAAWALRTGLADPQAPKARDGHRGRPS